LKLLLLKRYNFYKAQVLFEDFLRLLDQTAPGELRFVFQLWYLAFFTGLENNTAALEVINATAQKLPLTVIALRTGIIGHLQLGPGVILQVLSIYVRVTRCGNLVPTNRRETTSSQSS